MRTMVLWCPDWSVTAGMLELADSSAGAGAGPDVDAAAPAVVLANNVVVVCNAAARAEGVRRGQRRRDAQARCPDVVLLAANPDRDARWFEPVLAVVEEVRPGVAPLRPGLLAVPAPGRYFARGGLDGEEAAAAVLAERLVRAGVWDSRFGAADDLYTAERAARQASPQACLSISSGGSGEFLRGLPVTVLADDGPEGAELAGLLRRLGLMLLADFARLGAGEVANRFGSYGTDVWRRVQGRETTRLASRTPPPELACEISFEPPLESAEAVTFSVRTTAERFVVGLADRQLVATSVRIEAEFEEGVSTRTWLHPRCFTSRDLVDRVHWQLQAGMASSGLRSRKSTGETIASAVTVVRFLPDVVEPAGDHADGLWGGGAEEQVVRGVARVQAMVGYDAVRIPVLQGGRGAADRQALVPWGERPVGLRPVDRPWPGRIPGPAPSRVFAAPLEAEVVDEAAVPVAVTPRGLVTGEPWRIRIDRHWCPIASWAGPWPIDEGWWLASAGSSGAGSAAGRAARFQVVGVDGRAWLLCWRSPGSWEVEAAYD
ncbi:DNA polymerase Y family protein [Nocardioides carbamazepini]|uniref:Y-family DNA polymerase n=1 Tax=Nocardioides carbamazepini TaxID=2854259 RepID=UPI00214A64FC|nr:DNA polymerase Y family protein [Nocardioides carbamazepini]MCR1780990.1 DNA polymerase Y family protein [Nocardioides carbamazepini]